MLSKLAVAAEPCQSDASRAPTHVLRHKQSQKLAHEEPQQLEQQSIDTEAGMLSGISQKHNMRSSPCRFTEFCNSQCLSHFAAPFIVVRTETSIAESCNQSIHHAAVAADGAVRAQLARRVRRVRRQKDNSAPATDIAFGAFPHSGIAWCPSPSPPSSSAARRARPSASSHLKVQR